MAATLALMFFVAGAFDDLPGQAGIIWISALVAASLAAGLFPWDNLGRKRPEPVRV